jgi:lysophospholipase
MQLLSENEKKWVEGRKAITQPVLEEFLRRTDLDFNYEKLLLNHNFTIAHAFSGGGYRAMLSGAGAMAALDLRTPNSNKKGHLGGLLQAGTYVTGLSGGSWLLTSVYMNQFASIDQLVNSRQVWNLQENLILPHDPLQFWGLLFDQVGKKEQAGFQVTLTDFWSRALALKLIGYPEGGPALQWSDIKRWVYFREYQCPFPIVVADGREPGTIIVSENSTVFEITPFELGSYDPGLFAFVNLDHLGTSLDNGEPIVPGQAVTGFDNAAFIAGTSSSLFNQLVVILSRDTTRIGMKLFNILNNVFNQTNFDIAAYRPNPFYNYKNAPLPPSLRPSKIPSQELLALVDGGEDGQNIPLQPLLHPERKVDVIFAFDNSADTEENWPNATSLLKTYLRQVWYDGKFSIGSTFPKVPDSDQFISSGLYKKPTFFGCYEDTKDGERKSPLVVYMPNYYYSYPSNQPTFKLDYSDAEVRNMINNGYNLATQLNGTIDEDWSTCVACAILKRKMERTNTQSDKCSRCFDKYCWKENNITQPYNGKSAEHHTHKGKILENVITLQPH